jgi:DNA polymerase V
MVQMYHDCSDCFGMPAHARPSLPAAFVDRLPRDGGGSLEDLPLGVPFRLEGDGAPPFDCPLAVETVAAGFPSPADDYVESRIDLNLELIPRPLSTFFMRVCGDAMAADGILHGDLLVIDRSVEARAGLVVVATHGGGFIVRRLQRCAPRGSSGPWQLVASDGCTPPIPLAAADTELWGVVIHAVHHVAGAPSRRR